MLSQCPQCRAVFNVSGSDLDAHHGLVRCGRCKRIFHAVTNEVGGVDTLSFDEPQTNGSETPPRGERSVEPPRERDTGEHFPEPASFPEPESIEDPGFGAETHYRLEPVADDKTDRPDRDGDADREPSGTDRLVLPEREDETELIEPTLPGTQQGSTAADSATSASPNLPGEVTEEILIEAPPTLSMDFESEVENTERDTEAQTAEDAGEYTAQAEERKAPAPPRQARTSPTTGTATNQKQSTVARAPLKSPYRARDVRMVELPQPRPFKTASLSLLSIFLTLLLVWQVKTFYLDELAQVPFLRPHLTEVCRMLSCVLPPRHDFARIELAGTGININPEVPGALAINADLVNNADFSQPYPPLRVTLTDREGRVVGRRTYLPHEYRPAPDPGMLPSGKVRQVVINLAQPETEAVGYEVELVTPRGIKTGWLSR